MGAGVIIKWVTGMTEGMAYADKFRFAINWCSILVLIAGVVALCCYYYIDKRVLTNKNLFDPSQVKKKSKVKLSVKDSLKLIVSSPYLRLIAALVICYGVSINIVEVTWKKVANDVFAEDVEYLRFMGDLFFYTGTATAIFMPSWCKYSAFTGMGYRCFDDTCYDFNYRYIVLLLP